MEVPPPLPPEILRKIQDAHLPPSAPLFPRALAFTADGILAGLLACLAVHLLASVFIPEEFPVFTETLQNVFHEYQEATQAAAQGDSARANAFVKNLPAQLETDAFQTSASFIALTLFRAFGKSHARLFSREENIPFARCFDAHGKTAAPDTNNFPLALACLLRCSRRHPDYACRRCQCACSVFLLPPPGMA